MWSLVLLIPMAAAGAVEQVAVGVEAWVVVLEVVWVLVSVATLLPGRMWVLAGEDFRVATISMAQELLGHTSRPPIPFIRKHHHLRVRISKMGHQIPCEKGKRQSVADDVVAEDH